MTYLVASLGSQKQTWPYMQKLIELENWEKVFLIGGPDCVSFTSQKEFFLVQIDQRQPLEQVIEIIKKSLDGKIIDTEVALNIALGTGKEHMALLSACIKLGLGIRLVAFTVEGIKEV